MDEDAAQRLRTALEMADVGVEMYRQRVRREQPTLDDAGVDLRVRAWLRQRPGAEFGDHPGPRSARAL